MTTIIRILTIKIITLNISQEIKYVDILGASFLVQFVVINESPYVYI